MLTPVRGLDATVEGSGGTRPPSRGGAGLREVGAQLRGAERGQEEIGGVGGPGTQPSRRPLRSCPAVLFGKNKSNGCCGAAGGWPLRHHLHRGPRRVPP